MPDSFDAERPPLRVSVDGEVPPLQQPGSTAGLQPVAEITNTGLDDQRSPKERDEGSQHDAPVSNNDRRSPKEVKPALGFRDAPFPAGLPQSSTKPVFTVGTELPPLPQRGSQRRSYGAAISFVIFVILPTIVAAVYYAACASNQYVAEFRFAVTNDTPSQLTSSTGQTVMSMMSGAATPDMVNNYMATDYLRSRQVAEELQAHINVISLYSRPEIDWWSRFEAQEPMEKFVLYWKSVVDTAYDPMTGLATAQVRAFTPKDALLIANTMVKLSEDLINRIANRSQLEAVKAAEKEVEKAENRLKSVRAQLIEFRNRSGVIDPTASVSASNSTLIQTLRANLADLQTNVATLLRQGLAPTAPTVQIAQSQIKSTKEQIAQVEAEVGHNIGRPGMSSVVGEYEQLSLERQLAETMVTSTMQILQQARATAAAQHIYVTPYVHPSLPQSSTYPRRLTAVLTIAVFAFLGWTIFMLVARGIREHYPWKSRNGQPPRRAERRGAATERDPLLEEAVI